MQIKVEGLDRLAAKLAYLGGNVDEVADKGLSLGAQKIKSDAKTACPVDAGRLKNSIESRRVAKNAYSVGTNVEHAIYNEFGTGRRGDPKVPHTTAREGMTPHPFLYPALNQNKNYVGKAVKVEMLKAIQQRMD